MVEDRASWDPPAHFVEEFRDVKRAANYASAAVGDMDRRLTAVEGALGGMETSLGKIEDNLTELREGQRDLLKAVLKNNDRDFETATDLAALRLQVAEHTREEFSRRSAGMHATSGLIAAAASVLISIAWVIVQFAAAAGGFKVMP